MSGSSELRYLGQAVAHARELGLFEDERVRQFLGQLRGWLQRFQAPEGFAEFERSHGITIPAALKEFWSHPELVCAWTVAQDDAWSDPPEVDEWSGGRYLTFNVHTHSGTAAAVRLDGSDDPPVLLDRDPENVWCASFSEYVEDGFRRYAFHREWRAERGRLQRALYRDEEDYCLTRFEAVGDAVTVTLYPRERPHVRIRARFEHARILSVERSEVFDDALPSYVHDFDIKSLGGDRWQYLLCTSAAKYHFEAGWPAVERTD